MPKTWISINASDGSSVRFRASAVNLVQIPPSRLVMAHNETSPMAMIVIGAVPLNFHIPIAEQVVKMLDEIDNDKLQNKADLAGQGPASN